MKIKKITSTEGKVFRRKHDGFMFGRELHLGMDYSTGKPREDKASYYEEVDIPFEMLECERLDQEQREKELQNYTQENR